MQKAQSLLSEMVLNRQQLHSPEFCEVWSFGLWKINRQGNSWTCHWIKSASQLPLSLQTKEKKIWPGAAEHPQCTLNTQVLVAHILKGYSMGCKWSHGWYFSILLLIYFFHPDSLSLDCCTISEIRTQKKILTELNSLSESEMTQIQIRLEKEVSVRAHLQCFLTVPTGSLIMTSRCISTLQKYVL